MAGKAAQCARSASRERAITSVCRGAVAVTVNWCGGIIADQPTVWPGLRSSTKTSCSWPRICIGRVSLIRPWETRYRLSAGVPMWNSSAPLVKVIREPSDRTWSTSSGGSPIKRSGCPFVIAGRLSVHERRDGSAVQQSRRRSLEERFRGRLFQADMALDLKQKRLQWDPGVRGHRDDRRANEEPRRRRLSRLGNFRLALRGEGRLFRAGRGAERETRDCQPEQAQAGAHQQHFHDLVSLQPRT